jgi:hypothetical protein
MMKQERFFDLHPRPHAVFGDYDPAKPQPKNPTRLQLALRLIRALGPSGDCSGVDDMVAVPAKKLYPA